MDKPRLKWNIKYQKWCCHSPLFTGDTPMEAYASWWYNKAAIQSLKVLMKRGDANGK